MARDVASVCRICAAACGIVVTVDEDRVVRVRGDATHPRSAGYTCPKGRALGAHHHDARRIDAPRRLGAVAPWNTVIDDLARRLGSVIETDGPDAVGAYLGTGLAYDPAGWIAASGWLAAIGSRRLFTPATVDNAPVLHAAEQVAGHPQANPVVDVDRCRLLLVLASNPVVSHGYGTALADPVERLRRIRARGGQVWVVDPCRTQTARHADHHLAPRPGSDALLLAWLVRERLARPLGAAADAATDPAARAVLAETLAPLSDHHTATATDLPVNVLHELRDALVAADGAVAAWCGTGITMSRDGLVAEWLRWVLLALSSSLDTPDGMRFHRGLLFPLRPLRPPRPGATPPAGPRSRPELRAWLGQHPCVALADEIDAGHLKALLVAGANPITAFPEPSRTRAALARLDTLAVADVVDNEVTDLASHVLATTSQLERPDVPMNELVAEHGGSWYTAAVIAPAPQRRDAWWVFAQLTRQMTGRDLFGAAPDDLTADDVLALVSSRGTVPFAAVRDAGPAGVDGVRDTGWVRDALLGGAPWVIAPAHLVERLRAVVADRARAPDALVLTPRRRLRANNSVTYAVAADGTPGTDALLVVSAHDAAAHGITHGGEVEVRSAHGAVRAVAHVDPDQRGGAVSMSHGDALAGPGALTSATTDVDLLTGMPAASGVPVRLAPTEARAQRSS